MGNHHSSAAKSSGSSGSTPAAAAPPGDGAGSANPNSNSNSNRVTSSSSSSASDSPSHHHFHHLLPHHHRKEARGNPAAAHTTTHSAAAAPPEPSLAQATGSTSVGRPKSLPGTAVSSLSGSPHSNMSTPSRPSEAPPARPPREEPTKPVDVPVVEAGSLRPHRDAASGPGRERAAADAYLVSNSSITDMYLRGPPRLPLPIEEEVHTPGSPISAPDEDGDLIAHVPLGGESSDALTRKSSAVSATTAEDEDSEELRVDKTRPVVATRIEWRRGGDKIYVTGTIFQWNRKQRLHPVEGKPGHFATTVYILPGTHHLRFLADGIMQTSPDLPTTVDFGNNLVNYIEVNTDAVLKARPESGVSRVDDEEKEQAADVQANGRAKAKGKLVPGADAYASDVPQYLVDFDQPEDSAAYRNAVGAIEKLPTPPSLPGFLGKPILNVATMMKDDNSVLNMPNHTVLNHLATSSIKNNVLAVSATTRYHNKYVTTILYKPTSTDEG